MRVFESEAPQARENPIVFKIVGVTSDTKEKVESPELHGKDDISGSVLWTMVGNFRKNQMAAASEIFGFIERVLIPEDGKVFLRFINDENVFVDLKVLVDITEWLLEEYTERPFARSALSQGGQSTTSDTSMASASFSEPQPPKNWMYAQPST